LALSAAVCLFKGMNLGLFSMSSHRAAKKQKGGNLCVEETLSILWEQGETVGDLVSPMQQGPARTCLYHSAANFLGINPEQKTKMAKTVAGLLPTTATRSLAKLEDLWNETARANGYRLKLRKSGHDNLSHCVEFLRSESITRAILHVKQGNGRKTRASANKNSAIEGNHFVVIKKAEADGDFYLLDSFGGSLQKVADVDPEEYVLPKVSCCNTYSLVKSGAPLQREHEDQPAAAPRTIAREQKFQRTLGREN